MELLVRIANSIFFFGDSFKKIQIRRKKTWQFFNPALHIGAFVYIDTRLHDVDYIDFPFPFMPPNNVRGLSPFTVT